ncbi:MAG: hypothetical protein H7061_07320, partial [Bdellovibrionaceae bacterium]|nr:hypothetical protein [Bdellovibrio sp.]
MERRKFFKGTALSFAAVPFLTTVFHSAGALASEQMTDDEADYANWSVSPMTPGGQIRYKIIMAPSVQAGNEATCKLVRFVRGVTVPRHMH